MAEETETSQAQEQTGDPGVDAPEATQEDADSLYEALMGIGGDEEEGAQTEQQTAEQAQAQAQGQEGEGEGEGEGEQAQELSPLQKRFTDEEGNFNSDGALKTIEELGGLHSQAAKGLAEKDAYIQRLERALETSAKSTDLSGTQKEIEKAEKLLPEGYAGMLTESDLALIKKTVGGTIQSVQQEQREAHSQAAENAAVDRAGTFKTRSQGAAIKFKSTYGISDQQGDLMDEVLLNDPELTAAAERYIINGEGDFPAELFDKKFNQAYGHVTQKTKTKPTETGGVDLDALAEKIAAKLGISPQALAKEQVDAVSRETEHPLERIEGQEDGENDDFENYLESQGMKELDPSLKMLLREMERGTPT